MADQKRASRGNMVVGHRVMIMSNAFRAVLDRHQLPHSWSACLNYYTEVHFKYMRHAKRLLTV